jgi:thymidine kinase
MPSPYYYASRCDLPIEEQEDHKKYVKNNAKLYFNYATMNSGKSLQLMSIAHNMDERHIPTLTIKPSIDTRDGENKIYSRIGISRDCRMFSPEDDLFDLISEENGGRISCNSYLEWIFVDEAQFLTEEQVDQLSDVVDYLGINVMCYGLRTDFKSRLFPGSKRLFELADTIEEIKSTCECGSKTIINARVDKDGNVLKNGPQTLVGGDDRYISICRKCWKRSISHFYT